MQNREWGIIIRLLFAAFVDCGVSGSRAVAAEAPPTGIKIKIKIKIQSIGAEAPPTGIRIKIQSSRG
jgi:hypothetical protein